MALQGLLDILREQPAYASLLERLGAKAGTAALEIAPPPGARAYLVASLVRHLSRPMLLIAPGSEDARRMHDQLAGYLGDDAPVYLVPEPEALPYERLLPDAATSNERLRTLSAMTGNDRTVVVASAASLMRALPDPQMFRQLRHTLRTGQEAPPDALLKMWVRMGYRAADGVEIPGTFSRRGGIVDVFPPSASMPARLEFWGDSIESIRLFDPFSQRSTRPAVSVEVVPAQEMLPLLADQEEVWRRFTELGFSRCREGLRDEMFEEMSRLFAGHEVQEWSFYAGLFNRHSLIHYLAADGLLVVERPGEVEGEAMELEERAEDLRFSKESRGEMPQSFPSSQFRWRDVESLLAERQQLRMGGWTAAGEELGFGIPSSFGGDAEGFIARAQEMAAGGKCVVVSSRHARRLQELFMERGTALTPQDVLDGPPQPGHIFLLTRPLQGGWSLELPARSASLFTDVEVFGTIKVRRAPRRGAVPRAPFLSELVPGCYVVHVDHGVARFGGTIKKGGADNGQREFLVLEYAEGDRLYVPTDQLDRISLYVAPSDRPPSLTRLGTAEWGRIKSRAKGSAREMAQELLKLYAARAAVQGIPFTKDGPWQSELEDSFPFEETRDQARTIREVKGDMERPMPMDRLVCGDVGYGKTEVALRASFKAVGDGYQVAVLVPTTVLAQQHYMTFNERLKPFPVRVEVLSRFRSKREQAQVVEALAAGQVDIVIGTHRLLQKDVAFRKLGLVVVDEEQRFGVAHKERLKEMRKEVDVLTLTATPIPRTLNMSLSGLRDMSTMETPPEERLPVRTYVGEYSEDMVKEAILREMERGGQVFFLHNRVHSIQRVARELEQLAPQAQFAVAHGRMDEEELEGVMNDFTEGDVDVLVCTTIIESGLDIPNANTLIIDRADMLGLAQLYQLRGRVGRGAHRAHAYLFVPKGRRVTETAKKRLQAILEASELGAGFRIAMRDLEIRGAGNILGAEQSGHIHAVGYELYSYLLQQAVDEIKAEDAGIVPEAKPPLEVRVDMGLTAHIPESYIEHLPTRLAIYQRLTRMADRQEVRDIEEELRDRFGPLPEPVASLLYVVEVKALARKAEVESVIGAEGRVTLTLVHAIGGARLLLERELGSGSRAGHRQVHLDLPRESAREELLRSLERLAAFQERVRGMVGMPPT